MASIITKKWEKKISSNLLGKTIANIEYLTEKEGRDNGWNQLPLVIIFTDGSWLLPMADDEGNNGGALFTSAKEMNVIPVNGR